MLWYGLFKDNVISPEENSSTITVTRGEITLMEDSWLKRWNRPPTSEEREGLINGYIKEMVFYRVALEMGLDKNDVSIRRMLSQKLQFITNDLINPQPPTENELQNYFNENIKKYTAPDRITLTQIFFDPDRRGKRHRTCNLSGGTHFAELARLRTDGGCIARRKYGWSPTHTLPSISGRFWVKCAVSRRICGGVATASRKATPLPAGGLSKSNAGSVLTKSRRSCALFDCARNLWLDDDRAKTCPCWID